MLRHARGTGRNRSPEIPSVPKSVVRLMAMSLIIMMFIALATAIAMVVSEHGTRDSNSVTIRELNADTKADITHQDTNADITHQDTNANKNQHKNPDTNQKADNSVLTIHSCVTIHSDPTNVYAISSFDKVDTYTIVNSDGAQRAVNREFLHISQAPASDCADVFDKAQVALEEYNHIQTYNRDTASLIAVGLESGALNHLQLCTKVDGDDCQDCSGISDILHGAPIEKQTLLKQMENKAEKLKGSQDIPRWLCFSNDGSPGLKKTELIPANNEKNKYSKKPQSLPSTATCQNNQESGIEDCTIKSKTLFDLIDFDEFDLQIDARAVNDAEKKTSNVKQGSMTLFKGKNDEMTFFEGTLPFNKLKKAAGDSKITEQKYISWPKKALWDTLATKQELQQTVLDAKDMRVMWTSDPAVKKDIVSSVTKKLADMHVKFSSEQVKFFEGITFTNDFWSGNNGYKKTNAKLIPWYPNFADARLIYAGKSWLNQQDEQISLEHPVLFGLREWLIQQNGATCPFRTEDWNTFLPKPHADQLECRQYLGKGSMVIQNVLRFFKIERNYEKNGEMVKVNGDDKELLRFCGYEKKDGKYLGWKDSQEVWKAWQTMEAYHLMIKSVYETVASPMIRALGDKITKEGREFIDRLMGPVRFLMKKALAEKNQKLQGEESQLFNFDAESAFLQKPTTTNMYIMAHPVNRGGYLSGEKLQNRRNYAPEAAEPDEVQQFYLLTRKATLICSRKNDDDTYCDYSTCASTKILEKKAPLDWQAIKKAYKESNYASTFAIAGTEMHLCYKEPDHQPGDETAVYYDQNLALHYTPQQIKETFSTALNTFNMIKQLHIKNQDKVELHMGNWGTGVFANNGFLSSLLQFIAAKSLGFKHIVYHSGKSPQDTTLNYLSKDILQEPLAAFAACVPKVDTVADITLKTFFGDPYILNCIAQETVFEVGKKAS